MLKNIKQFDQFVNEMDSYSMDLKKDLNDNFQEWRQGHDTPEDATELIRILRGRHNTERPEYVKQVVYDWIGLKINEGSDFKYGYKIRSVKDGYELVSDTYHKKELVNRDITPIKKLSDLENLIGDYSKIPINKDFVFFDDEIK